MNPTDRFTALVNDAAAPRLDEAMLLIAAHALDVEVEEGMRQLDALAATVAEVRGGTVSGFADLLDGLFVDLGFAGNRDDYTDPRNSFLPVVIERRVGIPISLSVLAIEVGRRVDVPVVAIGMPGHFLVGDPTTANVYGDPFNAGTRLDVAGCATRFGEIHGDERFDARFLEPVGTVAILRRVLENLRHSYFARRDHDSIEWVMRLRAALPGAPDAQRELASALAAGGQFLEAADVFDEVAARARAEGRDGPADQAERAARRLRARTN